MDALTLSKELKEAAIELKKTYNDTKVFVNDLKELFTSENLVRLSVNQNKDRYREVTSEELAEPVENDPQGKGKTETEGDKAKTTKKGKATETDKTETASENTAASTENASGNAQE